MFSLLELLLNFDRNFDNLEKKYSKILLSKHIKIFGLTKTKKNLNYKEKRLTLHILGSKIFGMEKFFNEARELKV